MGSWTNIAALISAKTKEGGLSVKPTEGLPFLLTEGMEVTFVPPLLRFPRSSRVLRIEQSGPNKYLVYFEDVATRSDAEQLEGHFCLVKTEDLPEDFDTYDTFDCVGFVVCDVDKGEIGVVERIEENPAHPLLVVSRNTQADMEEETEVLIPVVDAFIQDIDKEQQKLMVSVPNGLLDL